MTPHAPEDPTPRPGAGDGDGDGQAALEVDVLVVGAGTAGIPCAIEAARAGARVLLVEKDDRLGGTLHSSGGHLSAAGTRRQAGRGITDSAADHLADVLRISGGTVRQDLVSIAVRHAADTVDWLDAHGFAFASETPRIVHGHEPYRTPRTYYGRDGGLSILEVLRPMLDEQVAAGTVTVWTGAPVVELLVHDRRATGAVVARAGGDVTVRTAHVVLATGGFAADAELFAELEGAPLVSAAHRTSTGDGLLLARQHDVALAGHGTFLPTFGGLPHPTERGRAFWSDRPLLVAAERPPWEIYVDAHGRRFVAEDEPSIDTKERALAGVDGMTFWMVFDDRARRESVPMVIGWSPEDVAARANARIGIHSAASLDDLARLAGIDPDGLGREVARYNADVAAGTPDRLGRRHRPAPVAEPPFFALRNHGITLITFVGVDVDAELRARRADGSVVDGLYAVGEVLGAGATCGNSFCGGMMVTPAITLGRLLGARLGRAARAR